MRAWRLRAGGCLLTGGIIANVAASRWRGQRVRQGVQAYMSVACALALIFTAKAIEPPAS